MSEPLTRQDPALDAYVARQTIVRLVTDALDAQLETAPVCIEMAATALVKAQTAHDAAVSALKDAEAKLLLGETLTGNNAEKRAAQVRQETAEERAAVADTEEKALREATVARDRARDEFSAALNRAKLLAEGGE